MRKKRRGEEQIYFTGSLIKHYLWYFWPQSFTGSLIKHYLWYFWPQKFTIPMVMKTSFSVSLSHNASASNETVYSISNHAMYLQSSALFTDSWDILYFSRMYTQKYKMLVVDSLYSNLTMK